MVDATRLTRAKSKHLLVHATVTLLAVGLCALPSPAAAWSANGHRVICELALERVTPAVRGEIFRLMTAVPVEQARRVNRRDRLLFRDGCTWPDRIRGLDEYADVAHWHYMNVARDALQVTARDCSTGCVLSAIKWHGALLADRRRDDWSRARAMMFLAHWVGDIHQPLHVGFKDDYGGNRGTVRGYDKCENLHNIWDYCLLAARGLGFRALLKDLRGDLQHLADTTPVSMPQQWANESLAVTRAPATEYCRLVGRRCEPLNSKRQLSAHYQQLNWPVARQRLQLAALRLARMLDETLSGGQ